MLYISPVVSATIKSVSLQGQGMLVTGGSTPDKEVKLGQMLQIALLSLLVSHSIGAQLVTR